MNAGTALGGILDTFKYDFSTFPREPELTVVMMIFGLVGTGIAGFLNSWLFRSIYQEAEIEWRIQRILKRPIPKKQKEKLISNLEKDLISRLSRTSLLDFEKGDS